MRMGMPRPPSPLPRTRGAAAAAGRAAAAASALALLLLLLLLQPAPSAAWRVCPAPMQRTTTTTTTVMTTRMAHHHHHQEAPDRRQAAAAQVLQAPLLLSALTAAAMMGAAAPARAEIAKLEPLVPPPLVGYEDPEGLFSLRIPEGWFTKRKSPKGGPGGEGILFISGDFNKAITLSVETLRVRPLMKRAGINVTEVPEAGYGAWDAFASKEGMAGLLAAHKEAMVGGPTKNVYEVLDSTIATDGGVLTFDFVTEVRVERPDLLMAEMGVSRLERHTTARALLVGDGMALVCWTAALSTDWGRGYDRLLREVVASLAAGPKAGEAGKA